MRARQIGMSAEAIGAPRSESTINLLWRLRGANMQSTADQAFEKLFSGTRWAATHVVPALVSGTVTSLTAGGLYTAASKAGNAIVAVGQLWTNLLPLTLAIPTLQTASQLNLSLSIGSLSAANVDVFVFGCILD